VETGEAAAVIHVFISPHWLAVESVNPNVGSVVNDAVLLRAIAPTAFSTS